METGGAQRVLLSQARWLHLRGYRVVAAFLYDKEGLHGQWQAQSPAPLVNLKARQGSPGGVKNVFRLVGGVLRLARMIAVGEFDAIESCDHPANLLGLSLARLGGAPVRVATLHERLRNVSPRLERLYAGLINCLATQVVAVSEEMRRWAVEKGIDPRKISVIPGGAAAPEMNYLIRREVRQELNVPEDGQLVLSAGRLVEEKGHACLLQAARTVLERFPLARFAIAGDGPLRESLLQEAQALGIRPAVRFLGTRQDLPRLMYAADVFSLPSRPERPPLALLEAMGVGAAVISTAAGGTAELLCGGATGLLAPPDDPGALAAGLTRLLENEAERKRLGEAAKALVLQKYTLERMCAGYAALLDPAFEAEKG